MSALGELRICKKTKNGLGLVYEYDMNLVGPAHAQKDNRLSIT